MDIVSVLGYPVELDIKTCKIQMLKIIHALDADSDKLSWN